MKDKHHHLYLVFFSSFYCLFKVLHDVSLCKGFSSSISQISKLLTTLTKKLLPRGSRKRKGKKTIKTVVQAQFHRGLFLLILEDDSGINYTLGDGITVSKFRTLQSLVNWIINSLASSSVL